MHQIRFFGAGAPPQTPPALGKLRALPQTPKLDFGGLRLRGGKGEGRKRDREGKGRGGEEKEGKGRKGEGRGHHGLQPLKSNCFGYVVKMRPGSRDSGYQHCNP